MSLARNNHLTQRDYQSATHIAAPPYNRLDHDRARYARRLCLFQSSHADLKSMERCDHKTDGAIKDFLTLDLNIDPSFGNHSCHNAASPRPTMLRQPTNIPPDRQPNI